MICPSSAGLRMPALASGSPLPRFHAALGIVSPAQAVATHRKKNKQRPRLPNGEFIRPPEAKVICTQPESEEMFVQKRYCRGLVKENGRQRFNVQRQKAAYSKEKNYSHLSIPSVRVM